MTLQQRSLRRNIRNGLMMESIKTIESFMNRSSDPFTKDVCQRMIDECREYGVDNYGDVPG